MGLFDRMLGRQGRLDEIRELRRANVELRREKLDAGNAGGMQTIVGLEDRVIQLDPGLLIRYINSMLAAELRIDREAMIGKPLAAIDSFPWGTGSLAELVERALADESGTVEEEKRYEDERSHKSRFVKIKVTVTAGSPQILIEDVTNLRSLEEMFTRYVSPKVIERMKQLPEKDFFVTERRELTVLFGDLRGFTAASQSISPVGVRDTLNEFLEAMIEVADRHEAFVDKVVGDEVMLLFGAPLPDPEHAARSILVAMDMQSAHNELCERWRSEGRPVLKMGVGINTGEVIVGNIGCRSRMDYTVLGHHVNVASRVCSHAGPGEIVLTHMTRDAALAGSAPIESRVTFEDHGSVNAKGLSEPLPLVLAVPKG